MSGCFLKFGSNDIFHNQIKAHPKCEFFIYDSRIYYNNESHPPVSKTTYDVPGVPSGFISLYELNVDRTGFIGGTGLIYSVITKAGSLMSFKSISTSDFNLDFQYGDSMTGSYPLSASIERKLFSAGLVGASGSALKNILNKYKLLSPHYAYKRNAVIHREDSAIAWDKAIQSSNLISIPSIFYGSSIKKGSVDLKYYVTGTLAGQITDSNRNGELIQIGPTGSNGSGSVAGVVLYNEGFILLTGSWDLAGGGHTINYNNDGTPVPSSWLYYGVGAQDGIPAGDSHGTTSRASASYGMSLKGTTYTPVITMLAHADKGCLNYSNNPTFLKYDEVTNLAHTGSIKYADRDSTIKNTISSSYADPTGSFEKQVFISKIGIYDEKKNLIAIAALARPVKKEEVQSYTFKLKLDI